LAISAFALLLYDPYYITEVGFQLAYLAVAGLIIFRPVVYNWLKFKNKIADRIWSVCSVSIAAQMVVFPLSAYYFHQFPVYFLVSNLLAVLPVTVIMYTGIIYLLLPQIPVISSSLGYILEQTILLMNKMLTAIERLPFVSINKIWITGIECLLLYAIIIALFYFFYDRKAWLLKTCLVCVLLLSISISLKKINAQQTNSVAFLSLRKHVGIVMKNGDKAIVISDLPDTDKNYKYSIQPYLDSSGVNDVQVYNLKQDMRSGFAAKRYNLIQFDDKLILICKGQDNDALLDNALNPDYVYVTGNARGFVNAINKKHPQQMLVIDGSNSDRLINLLQKRADSCNVKYSVLKRNKSVLIVSN
jgi:competence protein ComEC